MIYAIARGKKVITWIAADTADEALIEYAVPRMWLPDGHPLRDDPDTLPNGDGSHRVYSRRKDLQGVKAIPAWPGPKRPDPPRGHRWIVEGGEVVAEPIPETRRELLTRRLKDGTITDTEKDELLLLLAGG